MTFNHMRDDSLFIWILLLFSDSHTRTVGMSDIVGHSWGLVCSSCSCFYISRSNYNFILHYFFLDCDCKLHLNKRASSLLPLSYRKALTIYYKMFSCSGAADGFHSLNLADWQSLEGIHPPPLFYVNRFMGSVTFTHKLVKFSWCKYTIWLLIGNTNTPLQVHDQHFSVSVGKTSLVCVETTLLCSI